MLLILFYNPQIVLFFFALFHGDLYRVTQGYDVSGNVCGKKNKPIDNVIHSGLDLKDVP